MEIIHYGRGGEAEFGDRGLGPIIHNIHGETHDGRAVISDLTIPSSIPGRPHTLGSQNGGGEFPLCLSMLPRG